MPYRGANPIQLILEGVDVNKKLFRAFFERHVTGIVGSENPDFLFAKTEDGTAEKGIPDRRRKARVQKFQIQRVKFVDRSLSGGHRKHGVLKGTGNPLQRAFTADGCPHGFVNFLPQLRQGVLKGLFLHDQNVAGRIVISKEGILQSLQLFLRQRFGHCDVFGAVRQMNLNQDDPEPVFDGQTVLFQKLFQIRFINCVIGNQSLGDIGILCPLELPGGIKIPFS